MIRVGAEDSNWSESKKAKRVLDFDNESTARIFCFLSSINVLNAERINKRFQNVAKMYWQKKINFDWKYEVVSIIDRRKRSKATIKICSRIGDKLKSIILSFFEIDWRDDEFVLIGHLCPNITSITCDGYNDNIWCPPEILFNSFQSLKELRTDENVYLSLSSLQLKNIPKLIEIFTGFGGGFDCLFEKSDDFCNFFINHPNLVEIKLRNSKSSDEEFANIFPIIASHCPRLKKIRLDYCSFTYDGIELLEEMKELCLGNSSKEQNISDHQMIEICNRNRELEIISINSESLTIRAFESIVGLKKLRILNASNWNGDEMSLDEKQRIIQNLFINSGSSLTYLDLPAWFSPTTRTIEIMADLCPLLRYIKCLRISPESVSPKVIRYLIDKIVGRPEWKKEKDNLELSVEVDCNNNDESNEAFASFEALKSEVASLPVRVELHIYRQY